MMGTSFKMTYTPDEEAFFANLGRVAEAGTVPEWVATVDIGGVQIRDPVNDEMKAAMADFGAAHYDMIGGFLPSLPMRMRPRPRLSPRRLLADPVSLLLVTEERKRRHHDRRSDPFRG